MEKRKGQKYDTSNSLTITPTTVLQRRIALAVSVLLVLVVILAFPSAHTMLPRFPLYIAFYGTAAFLLDLITAYLLFGQCVRTQSLSLLALAITYLYSCLILIPHVLSFPGLFSETGLYAGTQTAAWVWVFWNTGFPFGILCSVLLDRKYCTWQAPSPWIYVLPALVPLLVILLFMVAIEADKFLPILIVNGDFSRMSSEGIGPAVLVVNVLAWIASIPRARRGMIIHVWLNVAALASLLDVSLNMWASSRFSLGWYLTRAISIVPAMTVLCALLYQVSGLYQRVVEQLAQLKEASQAREKFLSTMSHELRTPLTSIIGFSEMLLDDAAQAGWDQLQRDNLGVILRNGEHLLGLINDVLDLSKIGAGRMSFSYSQVNVPDLLNGVIEEIKPIALTRNLALKTEIEEGVCTLETDAVKLHQILLNLLSNALKFTDSGGVTLSATRVFLPGQAGEGIAFAVIDTGIGMPADIQAHVFEPFYQADMSYTRKVGGTGLGLSIVKEFSELLGGTNEVKSAPGHGSTFTVMLPRWAASPSVQQKIPRLHHQQQQEVLTISSPADRPVPTQVSVSLEHLILQEAAEEQNIQILLVDNNPDVISLVKAGFRDTPYTIVGVQDPLTVMERMKEIHPRAIILDLMMPGINGWQLLHLLKINPVTASIPVIILTALSTEQETGYVLGADEYIVKPFKKEVLREILEHVIEAKKVS